MGKTAEVSLEAGGCVVVSSPDQVVGEAELAADLARKLPARVRAVVEVAGVRHITAIARADDLRRRLAAKLAEPEPEASQ